MIRRTARFAAHVVSAAVAVAAIAFAGLAWLLASGPVSLTFLTPYLEDALQQSDSPYRLEFDDTILTWAGWRRPLDIRLLDVRAVGPDGTLAATAPQVSVALSMRALLRGMIAPTSLEIIDPTVRLVRDAEGRIGLGLGEAGEAIGDPTELLLADLLAPPDPTRAMGYLAEVRIVGADLTIADQRLDVSWHAPGAMARFARDGTGIRATAFLDFEVGGHAARLDVRAVYDSRDGGTTVHLEFADVKPEWIARDAARLGVLASIRIPLSGSLDIVLQPDAAPSRVAFDLSGGAGTLTLGEEFEGSFAITGLRAKGTVTIASEHLRLDDLFIDLGGPTLAVKGTLEGFNETPSIDAEITVTDLPVADVPRYWPRSFAPSTRNWIVTSLNDGIVRKAQGRLRLKPITFESASVPGGVTGTALDLEGVTAASEVLHLDDLLIDLGGPTLAVKGSLEGFSESPSIDAEVTVTDLPVDDVRRYWPPSFAPDTRDWIVTNLSHGTVRKAQGRLRFKLADLESASLADDAVDMTLDLENVTVAYLSPLPKVAGVNATGTMTAKTLEMRMWGGKLNRLMAEKSSIVIDDMAGDAKAVIDVTVRGPIRDALELLAHPRLGYAQELGIDPRRAGGAAATEMHFEFPLLDDLRFDQITIAARSSLTGFNLENAFDGYDLSQGALSLTLDKKGMSVAGQIALNGVVAEIAWRQNFTADEAHKSRYTLRGRFNDSQRLKLGVPGGDYITGPVDLAVEIGDLDGDSRLWRFTMGLQEAAVQIPEIRWRKPPGVEGLLRFEVRSGRNSPLIVDNIELTAGGLVASGHAVLEPGSRALQRLDLTRLDFGDTSIRAAVAPMEGGGYDLDLAGASLDLRPYLGRRGLLAGGDTLSLPPLNLTAEIDRVVIEEDRTLGKVTARLRYGDERWQMATVDGVLAGGKTIALRLAQAGSGRELRLTADDAGAAMRLFGIFENMTSGKLLLTATLDDSQDKVVGTLEVDDYRFVKAPLLARLLSVASLIGVFDLLKGEGLPFAKLIVPFNKRAGIVTFKDARGFGPALGFTMEGRVDLANDTVDIDGTLVPAYTLNSVLGFLPILGDILVGSKGGGVFAVTYGMSGPLHDPKITVNPLSALAPGILRKLFFFKARKDPETEPFDQPKVDSAQ